MPDRPRQGTRCCRSTSPQWGPTRVRPPTCAYDAPPKGRTCRAGELARSLAEEYPPEKHYCSVRVQGLLATDLLNRFRYMLEVRGQGRSNSPQWRSIRFPLALRTYAPRGLHRTCGEPNETKTDAHPENATVPVRCAGVRAHGGVRPYLGRAHPCRAAQQLVCTHREPLNSTTTGANQISPDLLHARCTPIWVHRTCRWAGEIKKIPTRRPLPRCTFLLWAPETLYRVLLRAGPRHHQHA